MITIKEFLAFAEEASKLPDRSVHLDSAINHARAIAARLTDHGKILTQRIAQCEAEIKGTDESTVAKNDALKKLKTAAEAFAPSQPSAASTTPPAAAAK